MVVLVSKQHCVSCLARREYRHLEADTGKLCLAQEDDGDGDDDDDDDDDAITVAPAA